MILPRGQTVWKGRFDQMRKWELILFDMDGTLYDLQDVADTNYRMEVAFYSASCGLTEEDTQSIFDANFILPYASDKARSATEFFSRSGLDLAAWLEFRDRHFNVSQIDMRKAIDAQTVRAFSRLGKLILLTSNSFRNVQKVLEKLELSTEDFEGIVCSDHHYPYPKFNKQQAMLYIMETFGLEPAGCISIGDRFQTDIAPMLTLGGTGILVRHPKALENVLQFLKGTSQDVDAESFVFYPSAAVQACRQ